MRRRGSDKMAYPRAELVQINLHHSKSASAVLTRCISGVQTSSVIALVQEPWLVGNRIRGLAAGGQLHASGEQQNQRACVIVKGLEAALMQEFSTRDLAAVRVQGGNACFGAKGLVVASAYFAHDRETPPEEVRSLVRYCKEEGLGLLIGCDANAHNTVWGSTDTNGRGEDLLDYLAENNLEILNVGAEPTFVTASRREVLDITFCNGQMRNKVLDWRVSEEISMSDHRIIRTGIGGITPHIAWVRNPRKTNWENFRSTLRHRLVEFKGRYGTPNDLEHTEVVLRTAVVTAFEENCPLIKKHTDRGKIRWSKELENRRRETRRLFNRAKKGRSQEHWNTFKESQRRYKELINESKRESWRQWCSETSTISDTARLARILADLPKGNLSFIKAADGSYTRSPAETLQRLMTVNFPDFEPAGDHQDTPGQNRKKPDWAIASQVVTPAKVRDAIESFEPYKAPGPDNISPALLQQGLEVIIGPLTGLFRSCIAVGYTPKQWLKAKVIFIPKPGRAGYTEVKDFRPISLTSFLLKTLERLVDRWIRAGPLTVLPLHEEQHAYQTGKSVETALLSVTDFIGGQLELKGVCLGVFLDVEGAFNRTSRAAIRRGAEEHGIPGSIIDWIMSSLGNRVLTSSWLGYSISGVVSEGCPQGGVLSPLLWCLVVDDLLRVLNGMGIKAVGYADDIAILARGSFERVLVDLIQGTLRVTDKWCNEKALNIQGEKSAAIIFTRRYKISNLGNMIVGGTEVRYAEETKYLGVILDKKLLWRRHVEHKCQKAITTFWQCRRVLGVKWGLGPRQMKWIYTAIIVPRITYASIVWWGRTNRQTDCNLLERIQAKFLRGITASRRSTPIAAMRAMLDLPPLALCIREEATRAAYRLSCVGGWKPSSGDLKTLLGGTLKELVTEPQDRIKPRQTGSGSYKILIPRREEWNAGFGPRHGEIWFTDGSKTEKGVGVGLCGPKHGDSFCLRLEGYNTVFQAEMMAIKKCAEELGAAGRKGKTIWICSDSQAALKALGKPTTNSRLVESTKASLAELGRENRLSLTWIPGHAGWKGNERADALAKQGTVTQGPSAELVGMPFQEGCNRITAHFKELGKTAWRESAGCEKAKALWGDTGGGWGKELLSLSREQLRTVTELVTGHCNLKDFQHKIGKTNFPYCERCDEDEAETPIHFLCECTALASIRRKCFGEEFITPADIREQKIEKVLQYCREAGYPDPTL